MYQPVEMTREARARPPQIKLPRRLRVEAAKVTTKLPKPKFIKIERTAQAELSRIKARLMDGYHAGTIRAGFIRQCFVDFPELVRT